MSGADDFTAAMRHLDAVLQEAESASDTRAVEGARVVVRAVLDVHRRGLQDFLDELRKLDDAGEDIIRKACQNPVVASLLLMHDLHPEPLSERLVLVVEDANATVGPNARATLVRLDDNLAVFNIEGSSSSAQSLLRRTLERLLEERAPDTLYEIAGGEAPPKNLIPASRLVARTGTPP